jgi:CubicO group peptidase (beta-lactamase class C family)
VAAVVERMAALPMDAQPGEKYVYGYNTDILGVVVEKVSGQTLAEFFQKRITGPLGLADTQFYLPPAQKERLTTVYGVNKDGKIERAPNGKPGQGDYVEGPRVAFSGGGRAALDRARLRPLPPDDAERRRARGRALAEPEDRRADDGEHVGSLFAERGPCGRRQGLRPRLRRRRRPGQDRQLRHAGRVRVGRRVSHQLLGRSEGESWWP